MAVDFESKCCLELALAIVDVANGVALTSKHCNGLNLRAESTESRRDTETGDWAARPAVRRAEASHQQPEARGKQNQTGPLKSLLLLAVHLLLARLHGSNSFMDLRAAYAGPE